MQGFFTGHDPARGLGQEEAFQKPAGQVGSGRESGGVGNPETHISVFFQPFHPRDVTRGSPTGIWYHGLGVRLGSGLRLGFGLVSSMMINTIMQDSLEISRVEWSRVRRYSTTSRGRAGLGYPVPRPDPQEGIITPRASLWRFFVQK